MTPLQYLGYGALAMLALYLIYVISTSLIWFLGLLVKIVFLGILLTMIILFLKRRGFFDVLKKFF